jgi:Zn-dependent protease with chaperone function
LAYCSAHRHLASLFLVCLFACAVFGQEEPSDSAAPSKLEIHLDAHGSAAVLLKIFERSMPSSLTPLMNQVMGCSFENPKDLDVDGDRIFSGRCEGAFRKRGLLIGGQIQFAPLMEVLKQAEVQRLDVVIRHPRTGFSQFTDNGWTLETTSQSLEYAKTLTPASSPGNIRLAFGYRPINFLALSLLLFPVGLTLVMRWAALRARNTDPVVVWFTYWSVFGWVITGAWLLWIEGSTVLDCAALARFLLNGSPKSPFLQLAFYLVPPILVQCICTVSSGAVLARVSGEHWVLPVSLKHAFWHEPVNIWPLLCLLAGVASLALFDEVVLGVACLGIAYVAHLLLVRLWLRLQNLGRYELPAGDLRFGIIELAKKASVKLKEIYLLPAAEGRLSTPYMIRRRRLFLSDALLRELSKNEIEAVLAREFVHFRRHHRAIIEGAAVVALPLIYRFSHLPLVAGKLPWAVRGPLLVWLTPVLLYLLWRQFERMARTEAAKVTGDGEALLTALPKIAQLNLIGLYWRRFEQRLFPGGNARDSQPLDVAPAAGKETLVAAAPGTPTRFVSGN